VLACHVKAVNTLKFDRDEFLRKIGESLLILYNLRSSCVHENPGEPETELRRWQGRH